MATGFWANEPFGSDPLEEFLARFFGGAPERGASRVDLGRLMSQDARQMVTDAAKKATELGSADLDTEHLLWAATHREPLRQLLARAGADPTALGAEIEEHGQ